ncbi:cell division protein ZapA [Lutibaculum baratangense]|uniref:Cell division protein ZapA n=1 Tax=Lutibaculum baratangense AMV1 TaxID=631454 RepID=V4TB87_9HYPH|nr:cell division protein ZapA [Lutibaculum baratangense]ESR23668.1 hypothetical protein N177_2898 [Lutibaculum baratangense AMV1]
MPQVNVTIAGRSYRMGCDEGQEEALVALAEGLDARLDQFRRQFGEIGDMRLMIMTALALADELDEVKRRLAAAERETLRLEAGNDEAVRRAEELEGRYSAVIEAAATRVERLTRALSTGEMER